MATSLTSYFKSLSTEDLAALLERRTDARRLLGQRRQDFGALAEILSETHSIRWAMSSLNGFLAQLLRLAVWLGPDVPSATLAEQVPGVAPQQLRAGAEELARWGLAFVSTGGDSGVSKRGDSGWTLHLPAPTMATVEPPAGFGSSARRLLEHKPMEFLTAVARNIGLASRPRPSTSALIDEVAGVLSDPARLRTLLEAAPPNAYELFERIRRGGGSLSRHNLMLGGVIRWSDPPWSQRRKVFTPLDWLEAHALSVVDASAAYAGTATIPGEVELALRGGQLFERWPPPEAPELALKPGAAAEPPGGDLGDPSKVVAELEVLLESWAETRPPTIQKGGLGVRELRKSAKALHFEEPYVGFLYALAAEAQLIAVNLEERVVPTPRRAEWSASPAPQRWAVLFEAWLNSVLWSEDLPASLIAVNDALPRLGTIRLRRGILEALAGLAPGEATSVERLGAVLAWRYPTLLTTTGNATALVTRALAALSQLGTVSGPPAVRLLEPGRSAVADARWFEHEGAATDAFPTEVGTCTVGADLRVIVPGPPVPELASALGRFADLKASSPARIYELSEASLRRGLDGGMTAEQMAAVLADHAPRGVPQNVAYLIEDVGRRYGHLIAGLGGLYLRSDDPALLRSAIADRRLAGFRPRLIAPTVAVLIGDSTEGLLAQLRLAGYLPVAEDAGGLIRGRVEQSEYTVELIPPMPVVRPLMRSEARELAEALAGGRGGAKISLASGAPLGASLNGALPTP
ncbi:MAG: helicase-associated domain-containing protein, partial [Actinomycetota bacterium]